MNARPAWMVPLATPLRACQLCTHGLTVNAQRYCRCAEAVQPATTQPVHLVRAAEGRCGPEARYLDFPGLNGR